MMHDLGPGGGSLLKGFHLAKPTLRTFHPTAQGSNVSPTAKYNRSNYTARSVEMTTTDRWVHSELDCSLVSIYQLAPVSLILRGWGECHDDTWPLQVSVPSQVCDWNVWVALFPHGPVTQVSGFRSLWRKTGGAAMKYTCHALQHPAAAATSSVSGLLHRKIAQVRKLSKGLAFYSSSGC